MGNTHTLAYKFSLPHPKRELSSRQYLERMGSSKLKVIETKVASNWTLYSKTEDAYEVGGFLELMYIFPNLITHETFVRNELEYKCI